MFCKDQDEMLFWFEKLKGACVINHFEKVYRKLEQIGKGAFARVFKIERIFDHKLFAAKEFDKELIRKN